MTTTEDAIGAKVKAKNPRDAINQTADEDNQPEEHEDDHGRVRGSLVEDVFDSAGPIIVVLS